VVENTRQRGRGGEQEPEIFIDWKSTRYLGLGLVLEAKDSARGITLAEVKAAVQRVDPQVPIDRFAALDELLAASSRERRFHTALLAAFALVSLVLALAGIYGTIGFLVRQRWHELGVRLAIGASPGRLARGVILRAALMTALAVGLGLAAAWASASALSSLVYGLSPSDPTTLLGVAVVLLCASCLAAWRPAWRAATIDPAKVLRSESSA
jgi:putative ABC transport system permease protein